MLRAVVAALVERGGCAWAGILFAENGELVLGPEAGEPDPDARRQHAGRLRGQPGRRARHRRLRRRRLPRPRRAADLGLLPRRLGHRRRPVGSRRLSAPGRASGIGAQDEERHLGAVAERERLRLPLAERRELAPAAAPGRRSSSCATKLTDAIRSTSSAAVCGCAQGNGALLAGPEAAPTRRRARATACSCSDGVLPRYGRSSSFSSLLQRVARARGCSRRARARRPAAARARSRRAPAPGRTSGTPARPSTASTLASSSGSASAAPAHDLRGGRDPARAPPASRRAARPRSPARRSRHEPPRQLAGAGREVDDDAPRPEPEPRAAGTRSRPADSRAAPARRARRRSETRRPPDGPARRPAL